MGSRVAPFRHFLVACSASPSLLRLDQSEGTTRERERLQAAWPARPGGLQGELQALATVSGQEQCTLTSLGKLPGTIIERREWSTCAERAAAMCSRGTSRFRASRPVGGWPDADSWSEWNCGGQITPIEAKRAPRAMDTPSAEMTPHVSGRPPGTTEVMTWRFHRAS